MLVLKNVLQIVVLKHFTNILTDFFLILTLIFLTHFYAPLNTKLLLKLLEFCDTKNRYVNNIGVQRKSPREGIQNYIFTYSEIWLSGVLHGFRIILLVEQTCA